MAAIALQEQSHQSLSVPAGGTEGNTNQGGLGWELMGDPESSTARSLEGELCESQLPAAVKEFSAAAGLPPLSLLLMGINKGLRIPRVGKPGLVLSQPEQRLWGEKVDQPLHQLSCTEQERFR